MEVIYSIMEKLICFDWIEYDFMKNALLAIICIVPLYGILGTMIVNNKLAFFSDALGHSAFTGMAIGVILGIVGIDVSMVGFGVVFALLLNYIKTKKTASTTKTTTTKKPAAKKTAEKQEETKTETTDNK